MALRPPSRGDSSSLTADSLNMGFGSLSGAAAETHEGVTNSHQHHSGLEFHLSQHVKHKDTFSVPRMSKCHHHLVLRLPSTRVVQLSLKCFKKCWSCGRVPELSQFFSRCESLDRCGRDVAESTSRRVTASQIKERQIILAEEGERGVYRLQHKGLAWWIKLYTTDPAILQQSLPNMTEANQSPEWKED